MPWDFWPHRHFYFFLNYRLLMCPSCKVPSSSILYQFQVFTLFREPCECMPSCQTWCSHPVFSRSNPHGFFWFHPVYVSQLFQQVNYVILENSPSLLFYPLVWGYEIRWGWILRRKSIIFQGFFLRLSLWKCSKERKAAFLHPLTQRSGCCWPRTQKTLEFQVFIHPNVPIPGLFFLIRVLVFQ